MKSTKSNGSGRKTAFTITLFVGVALSVMGFMLAAPLGSPTGPEISEPRVVGAPLVFVVGVIMMFLSPVVYELYPGRD